MVVRGSIIIDLTTTGDGHGELLVPITSHLDAGQPYRPPVIEVLCIQAIFNHTQRRVL